MTHFPAPRSRAVIPCLLAILLAAASISAQDFGGLYTSGDGGFSISIPDEPTERRQAFTKLGKYTLSGHSFLWQDPDDPEIVSIEVLRVFSRTPKLSALDKKAVINAYKKTITDAFAGRGIDTSEKPYEFLGTVGIEVRSVPPKFVTRILFLNERLVAMGVIRTDDSRAELQLELLDSFRLLSKEQHMAVLIRENTPPPLPQAERDASLPPDTAAMGLHPGVREIVETFQQTPTSEKERSREVYFDKSGNITSEIHYLAGYPNQIRSWGWIDGARVSRSTTINYRHDQPSGPGRPQMIVDGAPSIPDLLDSSPDAAKVNPPYGLKYEFKTDEAKRLSERRVLTGSGELSFVERMIYSQAGVETRTTDGSGGFISRVMEIVDKNGLPVEEKTLDSRGKPVARRSFSYEFDPNGNWITKRVFTKYQTRRALVDKPLGVYTRAITYY